MVIGLWIKELKHHQKIDTGKNQEKIKKEQGVYEFFECFLIKNTTSCKVSVLW
jgi:hypothetical protein